MEYYLTIIKYPFVISVSSCKASKRTGSGCDADSGCRAPSASTANCGVTHRTHNLTSHDDVVVATELPSPSTTDEFRLSVSGVCVPDNTGVTIPGDSRSVPMGCGLFAPAASGINDDRCVEFSDTRWDGRMGSMI